MQSFLVGNRAARLLFFFFHLRGDPPGFKSTVDGRWRAAVRAADSSFRQRLGVALFGGAVGGKAAGSAAAFVGKWNGILGAGAKGQQQTAD